MKYYSTNLRSPEVSFPEALLKGIAPDGGLYLPVSIPVLSKADIVSLSGKAYYETAFCILSRLLGDEIDDDKLMSICRDAYNFDVPLEKITDNRYILRLDRGPTASFKDFAARLMSRLMQHYLSLNSSRLTILTATSGDTGSAVASAFYGLNNIDVIILYPEKEVTPIQRKQMTTLQGNIQVIAIDGKFDDCQRLVKQAFADPELSELDLSSANSINIGRLLPQSVYYFYAYSQFPPESAKNIVFSVPSGNFGNLMGGIIAKKMGLQVEKFIISTNENDEVPEFLKNGYYTPIEPSRNCISSAMNVGHPSNLARLVALNGGIMNEKGVIIKAPELAKLRNDLYAVSITDSETRETINDFYNSYKMLIEPHGAVAWRGIEKYLEHESAGLNKNNAYISLETAHPAKFAEEIIINTGTTPEYPDSLKDLAEKNESYITMKNDYKHFSEYIRK